MINYNSVKRYCSEPIEHIEGYEEAVNSTDTWQCHHRLESQYLREELISKGLYYNRPASELIFLSAQDHRAEHWKKDAPSRKKFSETMSKKIPKTEEIKQRGVNPEKGQNMTEAQRLARRARQKQRRERAAQNPVDMKRVEHTEEVAQNTMTLAEQTLELSRQILEQLKSLADTDRRRFPSVEEIYGN